MSHLARRVLTAFGRTHPSMYPLMVWRLSRANCEVLAEQMGTQVLDFGEQTTILGIPVEITHGDEVLLVVKA